MTEILPYLPTVNALLNGLSAVFLFLGYYFIRNKRISEHRKMMLSAVTTSCIFLVSYLVYHYSARMTKFTGTGWVRPVYFTILFTHVVLAIVIVPLIILALRYALTGRIPQHRRVVRWAFPMWAYVSVTGVLVYLFLYQLYPGR